MAKNQRSNTKPMSRTFIFETDQFSVGMSSVLNNVPELNVYFEDKEILDSTVGVISNLLDTVATDPPCLENDNFPNTLSIYVSAKELAFLGDNGIAFGWRLFNNVKKGAKYIYQFRITFISNSMVNRKYMTSLINNGWKERDLSEKQSRFWNEASHTNRVPNLPEQRTARGDQNTTTATNTELNSGHIDEKSVPNKVSKKQRIETKSPSSTVKATSQDRQVTQSTVSQNEDTNNTNSNTVHEQLDRTEDVSEGTDGGRGQQPTFVRDTPVQSITTQNQVASNEVVFEQTQDDLIYKQHEQNRSLCAIFRGPEKFIFLINHYGQMIEVNINEKASGIMVDRGSGNIIIGDMAYNYLSFQTHFLDGPPMVEQAQKLGSISGKMLKHNVPDDSAFVPPSVIQKMNENYETIPESAHTNTPTPNNASTLIIPKPTNAAAQMAPGSILRAGRNLIIDKRTTVTKDHPGVGANGVALQTVRMVDDGPGMMM